MPAVVQSARPLGPLAACLLAALAWSTPAHAQDDEDFQEESFDEGGDADDGADGEAGDDSDEAETDEEADGSSEGDASSSDDKFGHQGQFGVRLGIAWGYRMVFRYDKSPLCAEPDHTDPFEEQQQFCGHSGPFALDLGLSFAFFDSVEPFLWGRFGLQEEPQTNTSAVRIIGAGFRIYTMSDSAFKIFVEPAVGFELEGDAGDDEFTRQANPQDPAWLEPDYKRDFVFHLSAGPHWDFHKNVGAYLTGGITAGIVRSLNANLELQLGVQGRIP